MLAPAAFTDLQNYIKRRISYAQYKSGSTYTKTQLSEISVQSDGTVRAQIVITASSIPLTVTEVQLYNTDGELWASQTCSITINTGQTGILYWFDFTVTEEEV